MMNIERNTSESNGLDELRLAIAEMAPDQRSRAAACFEEAFPTIDAALREKKPFKRLLEMFNKAYNLTVSAPTFRKLLNQARSQQENAA